MSDWNLVEFLFLFHQFPSKQWTSADETPNVKTLEAFFYEVKERKLKRKADFMF